MRSKILHRTVLLASDHIASAARANRLHTIDFGLQIAAIATLIVVQITRTLQIFGHTGQTAYILAARSRQAVSFHSGSRATTALHTVRIVARCGGAVEKQLIRTATVETATADTCDISFTVGEILVKRSVRLVVTQVYAVANVGQHTADQTDE